MIGFVFIGLIGYGQIRLGFVEILQLFEVSVLFFHFFF
jgi:hypothetical protein